MSIELIIFLVALVPVVVRTVLGWRGGATLEMRHVLVYLFSLLAALRYWKPGTELALEMFSGDPQILGALVFLLAYVVAAVLAGFLVNLRGEFYQSVAPNKFDNALGALCGLVSGTLLGGTLLLFAAFLLPGRVGNFDAAKYPVRLDLVPVRIFQTIETGVAGVAPDSPARTQFPVPPDATPR
jgi:Uncharacterized membrane protein, required for colicin V production